MDRRAAIAWLATAVVGGCGGGGSAVESPAPSATGANGSSPAPVPAPAPAPAPSSSPASAPVGLSPNIAAWGDSLTPAFAANLQLLYPGRTVYDGGVNGQTSTQIAARQLADTAGRNTWINVFWYGQNNVTQPAQIKADLAASIAALAPGNARFLVLSVVNEATPIASKGGADYATIVQLNAELGALYPQNFFDIRSYLVSLYDPTNAQDVADFASGDVPSSLRLDIIHLDNNGSVAVAKKVKELIDAKGW